MSAVVEELRLTNFQGYKDVKLGFYSGLNLIRGRNSSGKSTLLDALVFALFGEALDVKPRLLISRLPGSKKMEITVKFRSPRNGETVEITRKGRLDTKGAYRTDERLLRINGKETHIESDDDLRARVTELLGVSLRKFLNLVYVRQGKLTSILEPPKDQMDSVMGITLLRELREQTDEARRDLEKYDGRDAATEARSLEERIIPQLAIGLKLLNEDIKPLRLEAQRLEDIVKKGESPELTELLKRIENKDRAGEKIRELEAKIEELLRNAGVASPTELKLKIGNLQEQLEELKVGKDSLTTQTEAHLTAWSTAKGKVETLQNEIKEHESLLKMNVSRCPRCGQNLNAETLRGILEMDKADLRQHGISEEQAKKDYEASRLELDRLSKKLTIVENDVATQELLKTELARYLSQAGELHIRQKEFCAGIGEILDKLSLPIQPDDPELRIKVAEQLPIRPEELANKRRELGDKLKILSEKSEHMHRIDGELKISRELLARLRRRIIRANLARTLSEAFDKGVESRRMEFLKRIEFRALEYYRSMTDQHIYSEISIDPEEYTVWVQPRGLTEAIPASRVGGGHQTLLALSIRLALLDVLGFRSLLILDEPTYGVDSENLPQLASYMGEASRQLSQMILVTHHNICEEEASNIIDVSVRDDGASTAEIKL